MHLTGYPQESLTPRCVVKPGLFTIIPKKGLCANEIPCMEQAAEVSVLCSPHIGAGFAFYRAEFKPGTGTTRPWGKEEGIEVFAFVLEGHAKFTCCGEEFDAPRGCYCYAPPAKGMEWTVCGDELCVLLLYRQRYKPLEGVDYPKHCFGDVRNLEIEPLFDMDNLVRVCMLPKDFSMDFQMIIMSFEPGACHAFAETHMQEHGMYNIEGRSAYYLGDQWYTTEKDDFVWMGPYCPQAAYQVGKDRYTYLLTKDCNRDVEV